MSPPNKKRKRDLSNLAKNDVNTKDQSTQTNADSFSERVSIVDDFTLAILKDLIIILIDSCSTKWTHISHRILPERTLPKLWTSICFIRIQENLVHILK